MKSDINKDSQCKLELLLNMLLIRKVEERIAELYPQKEMRCPVHLCIGQEAVAVGVCACLAQEDKILSNHRSHGHYLAKGGDLKAMMSEIYGKAAGCSRGKGGSMHLIDQSSGFVGAAPIVGSTIPIAVGVALAMQMKRERHVAAVFFGDGAAEEGVLHESLNFAALKKLPIVFVCENNQFSVYSPLCVRQPDNREIYRLAQGHGVESFQGDGNDVLEVHAMAKRAVRKAMAGEGPTFLEFKTYRWREHCGPNDDHHLGYRKKSDVVRWQQKCPIKRLQKSLLEEGVVDSRQLEAMHQQIDEQIEQAIAFAKNTPFPEKRSLLKHIYSN